MTVLRRDGLCSGLADKIPALILHFDTHNFTIDSENLLIEDKENKQCTFALVDVHEEGSASMSVVGRPFLK